MLRRAFINGLFVAPAIIQAGVLMPISTRANHLTTERLVPERAVRLIDYDYAVGQVTVSYYGSDTVSVFNMADRPELEKLRQFLIYNVQILPQKEVNAVAKLLVSDLNAQEFDAELGVISRHAGGCAIGVRFA
jgi:hypothetical protein